MERDDFKKRLKDDVDISMVEILYPLLQGYDSVALDADVEIGGTDQKFNLLMGRKVQRKYKKLEQDIMTIPLLEGLDGVHKMSKSLGNYIGLTEDPVDMFGKLMSIPDSLIIKYFNLLTNIDREVIEKYKKEMRTSLTNPKDVKVILAADIVRQYYGPEEAQKSQEHFEKVFSKKEMPEEIETVEVKKGEDVIDVLVRSGMAESKSDARRKVEQGGVSIEGEVVKDFQTKLGEEYQDKIIKVGKRHFRKIKVL
jgi:tyrosyl-tRNA synthetase